MFFIDDVVDILFFICEDKEKLFMSYYKILLNMIKCMLLKGKGYCIIFKNCFFFNFDDVNI